MELSVKAEALVRSNLVIQKKNVALEVARVYHLIRNNGKAHEHFSKFFVLRQYRQMMKDRGMYSLIHRLHPALIVAVMQLKGIKPKDIDVLPDVVMDFIIRTAKENGFAVTRFEIARLFRILKLKPDFFERCMTADDLVASERTSLKRPLYRIGNLPDPPPEENDYYPITMVKMPNDLYSQHPIKAKAVGAWHNAATAGRGFS